jgi:Protein of unknown function (DUF2950)
MRSNSKQTAAMKREACKIVGAALLVSLVSIPALLAQQGGEKTFDSPGAAAVALYDAVRAGDNQNLTDIFGVQAKTLLHTGDDVADKNAARKFVARYDQMHRVVIEPDQTATLYLGAENWPFPISIAKDSSNRWFFDAENGAREVLYRRVGNNELSAIDTCRALVDAQNDYFATRPDGGKPSHYASKLISDSGQHNGLYWQSADNDSPIGPAIAQASSEGYNFQTGKAVPFHGYYFKLLSKQGKGAKGGERDYMVDGKLTRGFALVAFPAEYRNSGVMTFMVNENGIVYQKDLGPDTAKTAAAITNYDPSPDWTKVQ